MLKQPITFSTKVPELNVVTYHGDTIFDRNNRVIGQKPAKFAEFRGGVYVAKTEDDAVALLNLISRAVVFSEPVDFAVAGHSFAYASEFAAEHGIQLEPTRLSNGNKLCSKAFGESITDKNGNEIGDENHNSSKAERAEDYDMTPATEPVVETPETPKKTGRKAKNS